ncbi:MAG: hypothetical protein M3299_08845 [Thermoproteota archaeon]|nr:hypothetical protein [Thermoproteota archaeon]
MLLKDLVPALNICILDRDAVMKHEEEEEGNHSGINKLAQISHKEKLACFL